MKEYTIVKSQVMETEVPGGSSPSSYITIIIDSIQNCI